MATKSEASPVLRRTALGAILALAIAPYVQTLWFGFTLDDVNTIEGHRGVHEALSFDDLVMRDWCGRSRFDTIGTWRPFATLSFWLDQRSGAGEPWSFHLTNVVLYVALIVLADRFLARWCPRLSDGARWLALAAFAALGVHADVVPSPTGRAELLAALCSLASISVATCGAELGAREVALSVGALFLALLSKESSAPMAILVPVLAQRAHAERRTLRSGPMLALAASCTAVLGGVVAFRVLEMPFIELGPRWAYWNPLFLMDAPHRLLGALDILALYLGHLLSATGLAPDYSFSEPPIFRDGPARIALAAAFVTACTIVLVKSWTRAPRVADTILALGAAYLTVSNAVVPSSAISNRLLFFPSLWLVVLGAHVADRAAEAPAARRVAVVVAIVFTAWQARSAATYASSWRSNLTLFGAAEHVYSNMYWTQRVLAYSLFEEGRHDDAAYHLVAAEEIFAHYPAPVARDAISVAWDAEPPDARLAHLSGAFGARVTCNSAISARARLHRWGDEPAAGALDDWLRRACPP